MNGSVKKNGFSTLNRLLGKKNKDSTMSKSTSNLTRTMFQHDNSSSQNNKIIPLSNMSNAPFEQTFRITVCLPQNQLFVTRLGAKTQLSVLLKMVCDNKDLDCNKYEFRHPVDNTQPFHNELTIGLVGLNELRLVLKTDKYSNATFNTNDINKMRTITGRESLQSLDLSKQTSRLYSIKTTSPYSSTNSLNSIDSFGMSTSSKSGGYHHPPIAPMRKKRAAPRAPSQNSIPEQYSIDNENHKNDLNFNNNNNNNNINNNNNNNNNSKNLIINEFKEPHPVMSRKNFFVSSPNLSNFIQDPNHLENHQQHYNSNSSVNNNNNNNNNNTIQNGHKNTLNGNGNRHSSVTDLNKIETVNNYNHNNNINRPVSMHLIRQNNILNGGSVANFNHSRTSSESSEFKDGPEPIPRKRMFSAAKKKAPPAPPRGVPPVPLPREKKIDIVGPTDYSKTTIDVDDKTSKDLDLSQHHQQQQPINFSKVMLNVNSSSEIDSMQVDLQQSPETVNSIHLNNIEEKIPVLVSMETNGFIETHKTSVITTNETGSFKDEPNFVIEEKNIISVPMQTNVSKEIEIIPVSIPVIVNNVKVEKNITAEEKPISVSIQTSIESIESETLSAKSDISADDLENKIDVYNLKLEKSTKTPNIVNELNANEINETLSKNGFDEIDNSQKIQNIHNFDKRSSSPQSENNNPINSTLSTFTEEREIIPIRKLSNKILDRVPSPSPRSQSPLWTYTLPAPPKFADNTSNPENINQHDKIYYNDYLSSVDNLTIISDSNTTYLSDIDIKPIIQERNNIILENNRYNNNNGHPIIDDEIENDHKCNSPVSEIITDIEDGYFGGNDNGNHNIDHIDRAVFIQNLQTIDNDLKYLLNDNQNNLSDKDNLLIKNNKEIKDVDINRVKIKDSDVKIIKMEEKQIIKETEIIPNDVHRINTNETMENTKNHVIEQLTTVINNNKLDNIIRHTTKEADLYFEDTNRMSLSNFKMSTYSNNYTNIKSLDERKQNKNSDVFNEDDFIKRQLINDKKIYNDEKLDNNNDNDDNTNKKRREFMPMKRRSLTLSNNIIPHKSSNSINRTGSFHSTRLDNVEKSENIIPRSNSYLSLITTNEQTIEERLQSGSLEDIIANRRRSSSSDQSIYKSSSLQSLEIMKMILPSLTPKRKSIDEEESNFDENLINKEIPVETKKIELAEVLPVEKIELNNNQKEEEHKWKYQGPPSIKLASWNERPKIEVAIKSDKDYKFGGNKATTTTSITLPRGYRNFAVKQPEITVLPPTPAPQQTVSNIELPNDVDIVYRNPHIVLEKKDDNVRLPFVRSVEYKKPKTYEELNSTSADMVKSDICQKPNFYSTFSRPVSMNIGRPTNSNNTTTNTSQSFLNRFSGSNFHNKFNPVVRGFKSDVLSKEASEETEPIHNIQKTHEQINNEKKDVEKPTAPKLNYRTSFGGFNSTFKHSPYEVPKHIEEKPTLPFSQNTLRRTGLKDKIMPVEIKESPKPSSLSCNIPTQIHLKQQETVTTEKLPNRHTDVVPPPPPKMAPIIRNVFPKKHISLEIDPHDQLLSSIRNFNKNALKRS